MAEKFLPIFSHPAVCSADLAGKDSCNYKMKSIKNSQWQFFEEKISTHIHKHIQLQCRDWSVSLQDCFRRNYPQQSQMPPSVKIFLYPEADLCLHSLSIFHSFSPLSYHFCWVVSRRVWNRGSFRKRKWNGKKPRTFTHWEPEVGKPGSPEFQGHVRKIGHFMVIFKVKKLLFSGKEFLGEMLEDLWNLGASRGTRQKYNGRYYLNS